MLSDTDTAEHFKNSDNGEQSHDSREHYSIGINANRNEQCYRKFYAPLCNEALLSYGIDTSVGSDVAGGGSSGDAVTIMGITATKTKTVYVVGDTYSDSDITVTANYSDGTTVDVTSDSTINSSDVNTSEEGTYTVNVEYSVDGVSYTDSITITVSNSQGSGDYPVTLYINDFAIS